VVEYSLIDYWCSFGGCPALVPDMLTYLSRSSVSDPNLVFVLNFLSREDVRDAVSAVPGLVRFISGGNSEVLRAAVKCLVAWPIRKSEIIQSCIDNVSRGEIDSASRIRWSWVLACIVEQETDVFDETKCMAIVELVLSRSFTAELRIQLVGMFGCNTKIREWILERETGYIVSLIDDDHPSTHSKCLQAIASILESAVQRGGQETAPSENSRPEQTVFCRSLARSEVFEFIQRKILDPPSELDIMNCIKIFKSFGTLGIVNPRLLPPVVLARFILASPDEAVNMVSFRVFRDLWQSSGKNVSYLISSALALLRTARLDDSGEPVESYRMCSALTGGLLTKKELHQAMVRLVTEFLESYAQPTVSRFIALAVLGLRWSEGGGLDDEIRVMLDGAVDDTEDATTNSSLVDLLRGEISTKPVSLWVYLTEVSALIEQGLVPAANNIAETRKRVLPREPRRGKRAKVARKFSEDSSCCED
jgi:hypothetical protein